MSQELKDFVYKEHPEHGMRIILTFEPSTPFLVPVDKCVTFARQAVRNDPLPLVVTSTGERSALSSRKPPDRSLGARVRAFEFLRATLLRIANVRTPSECPIVGTAEEKLKEALFGQHEYPRAAPQPMGSKGPYPKARVSGGGCQEAALIVCRRVPLPHRCSRVAMQSLTPATL